MDTLKIMKALAFPFHPMDVIWKPGSIIKDQTKALALTYADLRAYQDRLDQILGLEWSVMYTAWNERSFVTYPSTVSVFALSSLCHSHAQNRRSTLLAKCFTPSRWL